MTKSYLVFHAAQDRYAIEANEVREIVHLPDTIRMPGQPTVLHGFLNLRGQSVPVVSLAALFKQSNPTEPGLYAPVIVLGTGSDPSRLAILADAVEEVTTVSAESIEPVDRNHSFNDCATAQFSTNEGMIAVLTAERLLLAKEQLCIASLQEQVEKRLADIRAFE